MTRNSAAWMALRASTVPNAPASAIGPRIQNRTASPLEISTAASVVVTGNHFPRSRSPR